MAWGEYLSIGGLTDTGGYTHQTIGPWENAGGDDVGLRFILAPLHSNSGVLKGGTGTKTRTTWGANNSDNYCEWLMGTAKSGGTHLCPNEPNGYSAAGGSTTYRSAKQHIIMVMYPEDTQDGRMDATTIDNMVH